MERKCKIIVIGDDGVGKSATTIQFFQCHFMEEYDPSKEILSITTAIEDSYRQQHTIDDETYFLDVFDSAGEEFTPERKEYYTSADGLFQIFLVYLPGFLLVYSITSRSSFEGISKYRDEVLRMRDVDWFPMVLVGNKNDLEEERQVTKEEGEELAKEWKIGFLENSAKDVFNTPDCFFELVRTVRDGVYRTNVEKLAYRLAQTPRWKIFERKEMEKQLRLLKYKQEIRPVEIEKKSKLLNNFSNMLGIERDIVRLPSIPTQPTISFEDSYTLTKDLETLLGSESYADVSIPMDEGEPLKAHKVILSAGSSVLARWLSDSSQSLPKASREAWQQILHEIYTSIRGKPSEEADKLRHCLSLNPFQSSLDILIKDVSFSDVTVEVKEGEGKVKQFPLHRCILHSRSSFFAGLMAHQWQEHSEKNHFVISDMRIETFKALVEYLYTDHIQELDVVTAGELLVIANRDDLLRAKHFCEKTLIRFIQKKFVVETLLDSLLHRASSLQQVCEWKIAQPDWYDSCVQHPQWNQLEEGIRKRIELDHSQRVKLLADKALLEEQLAKVTLEIKGVKEKHRK